MVRRYTSIDLVQLPRLDASSAQTLGTEVLAAAGEVKKLPEAVREAVDDLGSTLVTLQNVSVRRLPATTTVDPVRSKAADITLDTTWSGLLDWLNGWAKMPGLPEAQIAIALRDKLFPTGLKFTQIRYKLEWAESNTRLLLIGEQGLGSEFKKLGGEKILTSLRAAHEAYGVAIGVTERPPAEASDTTVREALDGFVEALRKFVVQATAMVRKNDPKSAEVSEMLLAPIIEWETPAAKQVEPEPSGDDGSSAPDKPEEPPPED